MELSKLKFKKFIREEIKKIKLKDLIEGKTTDGLKKDGMAVYDSYVSGENYIDVTKGPLYTHSHLAKALKKDRAYQKLDPRQKRIVDNAVGWVMTSRLRMER